jgi:BirA family transcriptional regulator, biotin operon repressor / biotin---[acetyl-CoA-carboxylase] ligase
MLDLKQIQQRIDNSNIEIEILEEIDSTNSHLKRKAYTGKRQVCLAESQTNGRGSRDNRKWHSPSAKNIYMSYAYPFKKNIAELEGLSLVVSMAMLAAIKEIGIPSNIKLKWPNDGLFEGRKLMGNLIEAQTINNNETLAIIGIGINANMLKTEKDEISQDWTSLGIMSGSYIDRNSLAVALIHNLNSHLEQFNKYGLRDAILNWRQADALYNKKIKLNNGAIAGIAKGVNEQGNLLLELSNGEVKAYSSAEVSICKN